MIPAVLRCSISFVNSASERSQSPLTSEIRAQNGYVLRSFLSLIIFVIASRGVISSNILLSPVLSIPDLLTNQSGRGSYLSRLSFLLFVYNSFQKLFNIINPSISYIVSLIVFGCHQVATDPIPFQLDEIIKTVIDKYVTFSF
jgi:hypothetical protein